MAGQSRKIHAVGTSDARKLVYKTVRKMRRAVIPINPSAGEARRLEAPAGCIGWRLGLAMLLHRSVA